jgi:hypothetical protein
MTVFVTVTRKVRVISCNDIFENVNLFQPRNGAEFLVCMDGILAFMGLVLSQENVEQTHRNQDKAM